MNRRLTALFTSVAAAAFCGPIAAEPTAVDVRVISKGAKFVGTSMGGCEVVIRDAETGEILARGKTAGSTGDTDRIMRAGMKHHEPVSHGTEDRQAGHLQSHGFRLRPGQRQHRRR